MKTESVGANPGPGDKIKVLPFTKYCSLTLEVSS